MVKRLRLWARDEHRREWRALVLLAAYAPGLAPAPLGCDLDSAAPHIRMSRLLSLLDRSEQQSHLDQVP